MKRNWFWILILVFGFATCVLTSASLAAEEITAVGVIEKSNRLSYLNTGSEKYRLIGQDFSKLIGRKLKVTGKLTQGQRGKTLLVTYMEFVRN